MLLLTLMLMGIPTIIIGLIPTYEQIGYWAALILVAMRFLQGMAVGGEWGGAVLMAVEHAPEGKKGFYGSLPQTGVGAGLVLASLAMGLVAKLPEADMLSWGWRLPVHCQCGAAWGRLADSPESAGVAGFRAHQERKRRRQNAAVSRSCANTRAKP